MSIYIYMSRSIPMCILVGVHTHVAAAIVQQHCRAFDLVLHVRVDPWNLKGQSYGVGVVWISRPAHLGRLSWRLCSEHLAMASATSSATKVLDERVQASLS